MESQLLTPDLARGDLASLLRSVQSKEKEKLQMVICHYLNQEFCDLSYLIRFTLH